MPSFKEVLAAREPVVVQASPIVKDLAFITQPSEEATLDEAEEIWPLLEKTLDPATGYGLAACQIGILKKVGFIRYNGKDYRLLNTRIVSKRNQYIMQGEGCLSIPGTHVNTVRYQNVSIEDDVMGNVALDESSDGLLGTIIQHEVDHFEGHTILDRKQVPIKRMGDKIHRNDPCPCGSGKKHKKCCLNANIS